MTEATEQHTVEWRGEPVGTLTSGQLDMRYLSGNFVPSESESARRFVALASMLDHAAVAARPDNGTQVVLRDGNSIPSGIDALVLGLRDGELALRMVLDKTAVQWLRDNVK